MLIPNLALISEVPDVAASKLNRIAAAIQKQITRDFAPIWGITANLSAFARLEDVPVDYWTVTLCYAVPEGAGDHRDDNGRPAAFVEWTDDWSVSASHEILEMLADPWGKRLVAGQSVKPDQGRVEYLVEICDPCQCCAYAVNGEAVSDFYTPQYFDPVHAEGVRYSYSGKIVQPRQVLRGGYLSWFDSTTNHWWQSQWYSGNAPTFVDCGELMPGMNFRAQIDSRSPNRKSLTGIIAKSLAEAKAAAQEAARNRAKAFRAYQKRLTGRE